MMGDQFLKVLPWLLLSEKEHNHLLRPVRCLEEVVRLDLREVCLVRETLVHALGVEIPNRRLSHDVQSQGTQDAKVKSCVSLFHEACLFTPCLHARFDRKGPQNQLHHEFARERENNGVEPDKYQIRESLVILDRLILALE